MASKADMNSIPPIWLSDKLENQIVVGSLRAYVRILENVIEQTENFISPYRDLSLEDIVETALEAHARIINRRSFRSHSDEVPSMISSGESTPAPISPEVEVPLKQPKLEPLDDFIQHLKTVKHEIITPEVSPQKVKRSSPPLPLNHVTPPETPKRKPKKRKFTKSAFAIVPKSKITDPIPKFTFIGGFFATTYNLQRESVALALDFIGIKVELYRVKIVANQNCKMYSLPNEDLVRVTFEVDRKTTDKILKMFDDDKCDLNFYKETEFSKKNKLTRELSDLDVLKWETVDLMTPMLTNCYPAEKGFRVETSETSVKLFNGHEKLWSIPTDDFILEHQEEFRRAIEQLVEEGRERMEKYLEELKKRPGYRNEHCV